VLKVDRNRRLFVQARFSRLIRAYILYRANRKKL
jgi:tRNA splicing ligase